MTTYRTPMILGCSFAALAVILGALGAHQLRDFLREAGRTETYELAVRYQFYHAFALLVTGVLERQFISFSIGWVTLCFSGGILLFSGSLYVLCFTGVKILGAVTPLGGVFFLAGWLILLFRIMRYKKPE